MRRCSRRCCSRTRRRTSSKPRRSAATRAISRCPRERAPASSPTCRPPRTSSARSSKRRAASRAAWPRVDIFPNGNMIGLVPRAATTTDPFNAIAEARRRDILVFLASDERAVGEIVDALELGQPSVSKHLKVLRDVGLVDARRDGRQVFYRTNVAAIRPLHEWTGTFERFWRHQLTRVKQRAERSHVKEGAKP